MYLITSYITSHYRLNITLTSLCPGKRFVYPRSTLSLHSQDTFTLTLYFLSLQLSGRFPLGIIRPSIPPPPSLSAWRAQPTPAFVRLNSPPDPITLPSLFPAAAGPGLTQFPPSLARPLLRFAPTTLFSLGPASLLLAALTLPPPRSHIQFISPFAHASRMT